jgi:hypothetical protein
MCATLGPTLQDKHMHGNLCFTLGLKCLSIFLLFQPAYSPEFSACERVFAFDKNVIRNWRGHEFIVDCVSTMLGRVTIDIDDWLV